MKKLIISFTLLLTALGISAQSNILKTNPLNLALGNFNITYEKVLNSSSSILFKGQYMYKILGADMNMGGVGLGYRYYITHLKKEVPNGFYVNPQTSLSFGRFTVNSADYSGTMFGIGAELGYQ